MNDFNEFAKPDQVYELHIGKSFLPGSKASFHQFKYDFTPAAIDKTQDARVNITSSNEVQIEVPHVDGSSEISTHFTGNKQPSSNKDCVLIYDPKTLKFTLERLDSNFFLKKDRKASTQQSVPPPPPPVPRSITPTNNDNKQNNNKKMKTDDSSSHRSETTNKMKSSASKSQLQQQPLQQPIVKQTQQVPKKEETFQPTAIENTNSKLDDLDLSDSSDDSEM